MPRADEPEHLLGFSVKVLDGLSFQREDLAAKYGHSIPTSIARLPEAPWTQKQYRNNTPASIFTKHSAEGFKTRV
ncbi:unnamed protein product [Ceratitis capitata]|uniref:(Mediterranean fruit fly) hypothetical protein n=1 Tax=Ceratitis capitata TaxID=7213 RepID=A0A811VLB6_CERCA|nr:unnamed protein product [Ceratitis capitata]